MFEIHPLSRGHLLSLENPHYRRTVEAFFRWQLDQDGEDLTTRLLLSSELAVHAEVSAKQAGILSGKEEIDTLCAAHDVQMKWHRSDGDPFEANEQVLEITGRARAILKLERVILNTLSRLSGIATVTHDLVQKLPPEVALAATRKTLWGMLDKKAVHLGGGLTHRLGLSDAVLAKDNHLALLSGGPKEAAEKIAEALRNNSEALGALWEIEVESEADFHIVIEVFENIALSKPGIIMLDNFSPERIRALLMNFSKSELHARGITLEASGGITPKNLEAYAGSGADILSSGFLTHTPQPIDFSLEIKKQQQN